MSLSAEELASMRETVRGSLPDLCSIQRGTEVNTGSGPTTEYSNLATSVPCRFSPDEDQDEGLTGDAVTGLTKGYFTLPYNQDVLADDRIVWSSRTFEVNGVSPRSWQLGLRVDVVEVR